MSTLYVDRRGAEIDAEGDTIVVRAEGERRGTVPVKPLERVIVKGSARLTTRLLTKLSENNIGLLVLGGRKKNPVSAILGAPKSDTKLRIAQSLLQSNELSRALIAKGLVHAKLRSQTELLREIEKVHGKSIKIDKAIQVLTETLEKLENENPDRARLRGLEGGAAAGYFPAFCSIFPKALNFSGRNRRPPKDPVNACLSLGYTMLHFEAVREASANGLDPMIGIYHDIVSGRESLACDLSEPMRAVVDSFVMRLFFDDILKLADFSMSERTGVQMNKEARKLFYKHYEEEAHQHRDVLGKIAANLASSILKYANISGIPGLPDESAY